MSEGQEPATPEPAEGGQAPVKPDTTPAPAKDDGGSEPKKPVAAGGDNAPKEPEKPYWADDWRQKVAEHYGAGKEDIVKKELRRLEKISDPAALYGSYRSLEDMLASKNMVSKPGEGATEADIKKFRKEMGVPESPDKYEVTLENGAVIGDADKPYVDSFLQIAHQAGATPEFVNAAMNWWYGNEQKQAESMDEFDSDFHAQSVQELKEELGPSFKRLTNNIATLFSTAPGGTDVQNDASLFARLMGGRMADGRMIGDDPDMVRWLISMSSEINPAATVVDDAAGGMDSIDEELRRISTLRKTDRRAYNKDTALQERERQLLAAKEKIQAKA